MPLYYFKCSKCDVTRAHMLQPGQQKTQRLCGECGEPMERAPRAPSSQVMESLDNGTQARRVERLADAERLYTERAKNDPRYKRPD